ncbi:hypothetical protein AB0D67_22810 [Streptosporangium sp. NPDC048047]|uniref:WXG100-like domain-containing protein n=1 Tax=Streptosporangium sp. NPDC048047 TaxID=3155748 RepID=UPI0034373AB7
MGFDGFLVPDWAKPYVGWAVGMDWPEGDESRCFRLADACAATARKVAGEGPLSSQGSLGTAGGVKWDGEALKLFAEHVKKVSGGRQAELVDRLVSAALELNQAGVQVEYTKKMIEVSVWFLIFQLGWLLAASMGPWGALSLALIGPRVQLTRMTIQQIARRLLVNLALFGGLGVGMDLGVQLSQSRRDGIDWESVKASAMMGALSGAFLTALPAGLSGLSTAGLRAGLSRAEMTAFEKFLAASTNSMWGMMGQSGLANGAATAISLAMSGQFDWEMVLKGTTAGVVGGADAHWAGQPTVRGAGGDGGSAHGGDGGGPGGGPAGGSPAGGTVPHDPGGPSGPGGVTHDPGGPSGSGGTPPGPDGPPGSGGVVPHDPGGPSGPGTAGAHQAGSGRPADPVTASGGTAHTSGGSAHAPADPATVLARAVPPAVLGVDGTAPPHAGSQVFPSALLGADGTAPPHAASQAVPSPVLRADGTAAPHAAPLADAAPPSRVPSHAEAAAPASASRSGGGPAGSAVRTENAAPGAATHPGPGAVVRPGPADAAHSAAGNAVRPGHGPEAAVPAPRDPVATGESAPAVRHEAGSIDSLINHGDDPGTATVLTGQPDPPAPHPLPDAGPDTARPPRPITLRDHESFAQSVATGITGPREPLRTGAESLRADRVTLGDGTRAVDKELAGRDARDREYLTSRLGQAVGADVAAVHITGERHVLIDWVGGERAEVRLNPDGSWEAPGHHDTADGVLLGLLDTLTSHYDRFRFPDADLDLRAADIDLRVGENGGLRAFDHEKAFQGILPDTRNPFVRHFFRETSPMRVEWAGNPLSRRDIEVLGARIAALEGEFRALGRDDWYANAKFAFDRIAEHAEGTTPLLDAREPAAPRSGRTRDRASADEARDGAPGGEPRDRAPGGEPRDRAPEGEPRGVPSRDGTPSSDQAAARLMDPGGELGGSAASGVRHVRLLDADGMRAEIVTFGDGRTAMRLTGRDAEAAEAAALTRVALGLDGPAVHRSGDVVYREHGDDALRRSIETGIRDARLISQGQHKFRELVTFNDGRRVFREEYETTLDADDAEAAAMPPRSTADAHGGIHRASETAVYVTRVEAADDPDVKPLVWSEPPGHAAKRALYDVLTLGETFTTHVMKTNARGESFLGVERGFADAWEKALLDRFIGREIYSRSDIVDLRILSNRLTGEDIAAVAARLEALRPEFERRGWQRWHDDMTERFEHLGQRARGGENPLLTGPDAVPHGPIPPEGAPQVPVAHPEDTAWPYDPATTRPDEALARVVREGDLGRLNEALADPAAHPDDVARVRAYAELVNEGLAELPHTQGTVQARIPVGRLPEGLAAGHEFTAAGFLEGVDDPRFLPDMDHGARLIIHGEHTRVGDLSGKPHQVIFEEGARFKVLGIHETSYGVKEYFVTRVSDVEGALPAARTDGLPETPPELPERLRKHFDEHRETTDAGVWYRDLSDPDDRILASSARTVRKMDGLFYVDAHGSPKGVYIGSDRLSPQELTALLLNEPGLRPDDVVYLGNCRVGTGEWPYAQEVANRTGHVVVASDGLMNVNSHGDVETVNDSDALSHTMTGRGRLLIFLPEDPVPAAAWEGVRRIRDDWLEGILDDPLGSSTPPASHPPVSGPDASHGPVSGPDGAGPADPGPPGSAHRDTHGPVVSRDAGDPVAHSRDAGRSAFRDAEARDADSAGTRDAAPGDGARDAGTGDGTRPSQEGITPPDHAGTRLMDPGGELGRSVASGVRDVRSLHAEGVRAEIVTFGDGRTAARLTGRDAEAAEAAALTRAALGLDGPAVHRSGDVVYREHGDEAPRGGHESPAERTRRGMYTVLTMGDGFTPHEVTVDAHGVHRLRAGDEPPARWGGRFPEEFLVTHRPQGTEAPHVTFRQNRLSPQDVAAVSARLEGLRPEFARRGRLDWHDGLMDRLGHLSRHADGELPVLGDLDGHAAAGTGERPVPAHPDGRTEVGAEGRPAAGPRPLPELEPRHRETILSSRREVDAGLWYRDPDSTVTPTADMRLLRRTEGVIDVGIAGTPTEFRIGERSLSARDLGVMLAHDPRVMAEPGAALRVLGCETAQNRAAMQELADITGRTIIAGDRYVFIGADRQAHTAGIPGYLPDGRPAFPGADDGAWHVAVPETPHARPEVPAEVVPERPAWPAAPVGEARPAPLTEESLLRLLEGGEPHRELIGAGEDGEVYRVTFADGTVAVRKEMYYGDVRTAENELLASRVAEAIGAPVPRVLRDPHRAGAVYMELVEGESAYGIAPYLSAYAGRRDAVLLGLLDVLTVNHDRHPGNLLVTDDGRLVGIDHGRAFHLRYPGLDVHDGAPFTGNLLGRTPDGGFGWIGNPLTRQDADLVVERVHALRPEFERLGRGGDFDVLMDRLYRIAEHAEGDVPLLAHDAPAGGPVAHHFGEHGEPVSYTRDTEAFDRVYDDAATRFAEGEPVDAIVPYMTEDATDGVGAPGGGRGFGVELEFALPPIPWKDWPPVVESIARELHDAGLAEDPIVYDYHDSGKGYDRGWRLELEADSGIAGEVISPILHDDPASWHDLERAAGIIRSHGGEATALTGGHVHVGIPDYGTSVARHVRLLKIYHAFEDVLFRIAQNPVDELGMHRGYDNCLPNADPSHYRASFDNIRLYNLGVSAVSMTDARGLPSDHLEFRMWDGHVDPGIIQTRIKLSLALAELASREIGDIPPPERLGHHEERLRNGERISREEETASFRALADLVFSRTADKEQLTALFALNNWQPTLERYMKLMED